MTQHVLAIRSPGPGASFQDLGRPGFKRFGVPPGGAMDRWAACLANTLVGNAPEAPVVEFLFSGAELMVLQDTWFALAGACAADPIGKCRACLVRRGTCLRLRDTGSGVWTYLAVAGGFLTPRYLGSVSTHERAELGRPLTANDLLAAPTAPAAPAHPHWLAARACLARAYEHPPTLRFFHGPQWDDFTFDSRELLTASPWRVSPRSDRTGYRLEGPALMPPPGDMISEPTLCGSVQVPPSGGPIVTMRDGPTIGGYPKIALISAEDLDWLAQCRPGVPFSLAPAP